jgi:glycosyltransferase involved in cell wall biosynthesis
LGEEALERAAKDERDGMSRQQSPVRFLLISWNMPPAAGGAAVVTRNLLMNFDPDSCVLMGQLPSHGRMSLEGFENYRRIEIPSPSIHWRLKPWIEPFYAIPKTIREGCRAVREYDLQAVVTVYPNAAMLYAGYRIAKKMGLPFFPHFHNLYPEFKTNPVDRFIARRLQKVVFRGAERVFSMSQGMTDFHREHYGQESTPLLHPLNLPIPEYEDLTIPEKPYTVTFSGSVNFTMLEPLRQVIHAIGDDPDYRIVLHSYVSTKQIRDLAGVWADNIEVRDKEKQEELVASLNECDVCLMGLHNGLGQQAEWDFRTQFPTRTLEMLVARKPILLFSPKEYFFARFMDENGCARVVDTLDPAVIRREIDQMCTDNGVRSACVKAALDVAENYRGPVVAEVLRSHIERAVHRR